MLSKNTPGVQSVTEFVPLMSISYLSLPERCVHWRILLVVGWHAAATSFGVVRAHCMIVVIAH